MGIGKSVFDDDYEGLIFTLSKPNEGWAPSGSGLRAQFGVGWRRNCAQTCDPASGDPNCYNSEDECECDRAGGRYDPDWERCMVGKWCIYNVLPNPSQGTKGEVCPDCCLDTNMVMWNSSDPDWIARSFVPYAFCGGVTALNPQGNCGVCAVAADVRCNGVCKNCANDKVTKDAAGNDIQELDCGDIDAHCGIDPTNCNCVKCRPWPDFDVHPGANKWCCPKCQQGEELISMGRHRISKEEYERIINDKDLACKCCPPAWNDQQLDVSKLPGACEFITKKYKCMAGDCIQDDAGKYNSIIDCRDSGCEDYDCINAAGGQKKCEKKNGKNAGEVLNPKKGQYGWSIGVAQTPIDKCEKGCDCWKCTETDPNLPWKSCCEPSKIQEAVAAGSDPYQTEALCISKSVCETRTPCPFPLKNANKCACECWNGNVPNMGDPDPCGNNGPLGPFGGGGGSTGGGGGDGGGGDGGGGDGGGGTSSGSSNTCGANASQGPDGQCYCNAPSAILVGTSCACAPGYVFGPDGVTCCDPINTPGGCDGVGGTFMEPIDLSSMCDGVDCPPGQRCHHTVFGAECR